MSTTDAFERVLAGVSRFQREVYPNKQALFESLATGQDPKVLFLTCADSRVNPNLITQADPGELFICRNIGNVIPPHGTSDGGVATVMEYALDVLEIEHIIICGHSGCGAIKSLLDPPVDIHVPQVTAWLRFAQTARRVAQSLHKLNPEIDLLRTTTEQNVIAQMTNIRTYPEVASKMAVGTLQLHGWYYDIGSGEIDVYHPDSGRFLPLAAGRKQAGSA